MDEETTFTQTEKFNELVDLCNEQLDFVKSHPDDRQKRLSQCKTVLKELEGVLEHIEQEATVAENDRRVKEAAAKGYRNQYSQLVKSIMKADKEQPQGAPSSNGYRFISDMISDKDTVEGNYGQELGSDYRSADLDSRNEEVQAMRRNFVLENKLVIGAAILLFLFVVAFCVLLIRS